MTGEHETLMEIIDYCNSWMRLNRPQDSDQYTQGARKVSDKILRIIHERGLDSLLLDEYTSHMTSRP